MIVCPQCSHRNPEGRESCAACGASLAQFIYRACPSCGALNPAPNIYCDRCLTRLIPDALEPLEANEGPDIASYAPSDTSLPTSSASSPPLDEGTPVENLEEAEDAESATPSRGTSADTPRGNRSQSPPTVRTTTWTPHFEPEERAHAETLPNPLDDLEEALPIAEVVTRPHVPSAGEAATTDPAAQAQAQWYQWIAQAAAPLQAAGQVLLPTRPSALPRVGRMLLYLAVLAAAILPLVSGGATATLVQPRSAVTGLAQSMDELPVGSVVLLSFDYEPTYAGEINALAYALVRQLAARSIRAVVMSTTPSGVGLADEVFRAVSAEVAEYRYGEDFLLLGYLPGDESGLRTLSTGLSRAFQVDYAKQRPLDTWELASDAPSLEDFDKLIVLADSDQVVRRWIEQVQSRLDIPLVALVSAQVEPMLVPYRQSGQISDLVAGSAGAAEYEVATGAQPTALSRADGFAALLLLVVLVAVITNAVYISKGNTEGRAQE